MFLLYHPIRTFVITFMGGFLLGYTARDADLLAVWEELRGAPVSPLKGTATKKQ